MSLFMVVLGLGIGMVMQVLVLAVQNDVAAADLGVATSAASFFRSLSGSIGAAGLRRDHVHTAVLRAGRPGCWRHRDRDRSRHPGSQPGGHRGLPADVQQAVADVFAQAISTVFLVAVPLALVALLLVSLLEEKPLRETVHVAGGGPAEDLALTFEEIEPDHVMTPPPATGGQDEGPPPG